MDLDMIVVDGERDFEKNVQIEEQMANVMLGRYLVVLLAATKEGLLTKRSQMPLGKGASSETESILVNPRCVIYQGGSRLHYKSRSFEAKHG